MNVRECVPGDLDAVYALICELDDEILDYDGFSRVFFFMLEDEGNRAVVAEENGIVIAFIGLNMREVLHHTGRVMTIDDLIVHAPFRGKGCGKLLLDETIRIAKETGCGCIELTSNFARPGAHKFYEDNGFDRTSYKFELEFSE